MIIAIGFTGGRFDHQLAACSALMRFAHVPCVMLGAQEVIFHCPNHLNLELPKGAVVSLYPLKPVTGRSTGLRWPIDGLDLRAGGRIGTSNEASGGEVDLQMDGPGMLVMMPRDALHAVVTALTKS